MSTAIRTNAGVLTNAVIGTAPSAALGPGPLRLAGLASRTTATLLAVTASGDVQASVLASSDLPVPIVFPTSGVAPPSTSPRSLGTRIVYYPVVPGDVDYAVGIEAGASWYAVPSGLQHKWYIGTTPCLRLDGVGTLVVENGSGILSLNSSSGSGRVESTVGLEVRVGSGHVTVNTALNAALYPFKPYATHLGNLANKWLSIHGAELWVETLVAASTMATIGGRVLIGPTTTLVKPQQNGASPFGFYCKHNQLAINDLVRLEANGKFEIWQINAGPTSHPADADVPVPYYSYGAFRVLGGPWTWDAGDAIFNTGQTGHGFIDLYSVRGAKAIDLGMASEFGPTIVGNVRASNAPTDWLPRWAIGHLSGLYGNPIGVYGAAFGSPAGAHIQIDATNGITILAGDNRSTGQWDMSGNLRLGYATGAHIYLDVTFGSFRIRDNAGTDRVVFDGYGAGSLYSGLTVGDAAKPTVPVASAGVKYIRSALAGNWNSGRGFYFHYDPADEMTRALIGDASGDRLQWDGSNIRLHGRNVTITPETGITVVSTPGSVWAPTYGYNVTNTTYGGWASMWGYEVIRSSDSWAERAIVLDNMMTNVYSYAKHVMQGQGTTETGAPAMAYSLTCQSGSPAESSFTFAGGHTTFATGGGIRMLGALMIGADRAAVAQIELTADSAMKPGTSTWQITPSNADAKTDIRNVDPIEALGIVRRAPIKRFRYTGKYAAPAGMNAIGMLAEDARAIMPESVTIAAATGAASWNAHELVMLTIAAVQALADRLEALEDKE